jgi:AraC family transcriptional regulator of adaptative response/methylated-DNA-[protein]-cysteine methyltransferase
MVSVDAVSPGEFKARGRGLTLRWGIHSGPFGDFLIAATERGITTLKFLGGRDSRRSLLEEMRTRWTNATIEEDPRGTGKLAAQVVRAIEGRKEGEPLRVHLRGTNFQLKVWEALLRIPPGGAVTYEALATEVGSPEGTRATAGAIAANPVVWLIPCHRVIRKTGAFGDYQGGEARKRALLAWESVRAG